MASALDNMPEAVLRRRQIGTDAVAELYGVSVPELRRRYRDGLIPQPNRFGPRKLSWTLGVILDDIDSKTNAQAA